MLPPGAMDCAAVDPSIAGLCVGLSTPMVVRAIATGSASVRVVEPLTGQIAIGHQIEAARAGSDAADGSAEQSVADARYQAADAWFLAVQAERQLDIVDAQVTSLESRVAIAQFAFDEKSATKNDLLLAQLALAQVRQSVLQVTSLRSTARLRLGLAIGNGGYPVAPAGGDEREPRRAPDVESLVARALVTRDDLGALRAQARGADASAEFARSLRYPNVNAVGVYAHSEGQGLFAERDSGFVGVTLDWTAWSFGSKQDAWTAAKLSADVAAAQLDAASAGVRVEVSARAEAVDAAASGYAVATGSIAQAEESLKIAETRQQAGTGTMTEVLDAEAALVRARSAQATSLYDSHRAEAALERAVGADPWAP